VRSDEFFGTGCAVEAGRPKSSRHLAPLNRSAPSLTEVDAGCTSDQHTAAVLIEIGISEARIAELKQQKIIGL
jgi:crotonobetainyl-CoA:carnitine CoA-transferase CaiB-like acyl-CoA transferase